MLSGQSTPGRIGALARRQQTKVYGDASRQARRISNCVAEATMNLSSRTPEGEPLRCPVCRARHRVDVANPPGDSVCPSCGVHAWLPPGSDRIGTTEACIREQVQEFAELCRSAPPVIRLAASLVSVVTSCLAAHGAILWMPTKQGWWSRKTTLRPMACVGATDSSTFADEVQSSGQPILRSAMVAERDTLLIGVPVLRDHRFVGVIEVIQRGGSPLATQRGYLRFVCQMAEIVADCRSLPA
jgi:hypothetical protein